jgi:hypothetical protein
MSLLQGSKQLGAGDAAKPNADDTEWAEWRRPPAVAGAVNHPALQLTCGLDGAGRRWICWRNLLEVDRSGWGKGDGHHPERRKRRSDSSREHVVERLGGGQLAHHHITGVAGHDVALVLRRSEGRPGVSL